MLRCCTSAAAAGQVCRWPVLGRVAREGGQCWPVLGKVAREGGQLQGRVGGQLQAIACLDHKREEG